MVRPVFRLPSVLSLVALLAACGRDAPPFTAPDSGAAPPYAFASPDAAFALPSALDEISGLTALDARHLGAVEDETGTLYVLSAETGGVVETRDFGLPGDYEGVEQVGATTYILRSDGRLFVLSDWRGGSAMVTLDTGLHGDCDAEGLAHDGERLLIACKESAGRGRPAVRAVFAFDLAQNALLPAPVYTIRADSLAARTGAPALDERVRALVRPFADINGFKPSALALHPISGHVYVLSSVRKLIVALEPDGTVHAVWRLSEPIFRQPEGLAFLPDGTLFIASEGDGGDPVLARFTYRPAP